MRKVIIAALVGLPLLAGAGFAQTAPGPQTAAVETSTPAPAAALNPGDITRDQYIQRAQDRAAQRAAARFDQMDTNHDGVLDRAERRAWRDQHTRHAAAQTPQPAVQ